jgi:hypothetical protein
MSAPAAHRWPGTLSTRLGQNYNWSPRTLGIYPIPTNGEALLRHYKGIDDARAFFAKARRVLAKESKTPELSLPRLVECWQIQKSLLNEEKEY